MLFVSYGNHCHGVASLVHLIEHTVPRVLKLPQCLLGADN
jgi:hypothetical protein